MTTAVVEPTHDARERAARLVAAESEVVALRAQVAALTEEMTDAIADRDNAEIALTELRDCYPRKLYVPGDAEPAPDDSTDRPLVLCALGGHAVGRLFTRQGYSASWRAFDYTVTAYEWRFLMEHAPLLDVTGSGAWRLRDHLKDRENFRDTVIRRVWSLESELRNTLAAYPVLVERRGVELPGNQRAGSVEEVVSVIGALTKALPWLANAAARAPG